MPTPYSYIAIAVLLAALLIFTAARKLSHRPDVVASYARVGVPEHRLDLLALLLIAGALGLVAGILFEPIGIAASACLVVYFALAVAAHLRHRDLGNIPIPVLITILCAVALALRIL